MKILFLCLISLLPCSSSAQGFTQEQVDKLPSSPIKLTSSYGPDPLQVGDLRLPAGKGPFPVVVVIHGGCWVGGLATRQNTAALASALTAKGYATWNIEYRAIGDANGGWPGTFKDWAIATDHLRWLARTQPLDLNHVSAIGHSAGAYAALWLASRSKLPPNSLFYGSIPQPIHSVIAIDGPPNLERFIGFDGEVCGGPVVRTLMGGSPKDHPDRYGDANPATRLPLKVPTLLITATVLRPVEAETYKREASAAGDSVEILRTRHANHFDVIAPPSEAWKTEEPLILKTLR